MELNQTFNGLFPRVQGHPQGTPVVVARTREGKALTVTWWVAPAIASLSMAESTHVDVDLPGDPKGSKQHAWLARREDTGLVVGGTGGVSTDWLSIPRVSFGEIPGGIRLDVTYDHESPKRLDYFWA